VRLAVDEHLQLLPAAHSGIADVGRVERLLPDVEEVAERELAAARSLGRLDVDDTVGLVGVYPVEALVGVVDPDPAGEDCLVAVDEDREVGVVVDLQLLVRLALDAVDGLAAGRALAATQSGDQDRSEEHTSELQS